MRPEVILLVHVLVTFICNYNPAATASLGDVCTSDSDCSSSLANSECSRMYDCETGTCDCTSEYGNSAGNGCQKILRGYLETCGSAYYCNGENQECNADTGLCQCTYWYDYSSLAGKCTLRSYKLLTESCGGWYNLLCLPDLEESGGICDNTCQCPAGYIADVSEYMTCRSPRYGESCEWSPSCTVSFNTSTISDDTTSLAPSCTDHECTCPPSHEHIVVNGNHLCLDSLSEGVERYENGENCTHFNECKSYLCVKCPAVSNGVCMAELEMNSTMTESDSGAVGAIHTFINQWIFVNLLSCVLLVF